MRSTSEASWLISLWMASLPVCDSEPFLYSTASSRTRWRMEWTSSRLPSAVCTIETPSWMLRWACARPRICARIFSEMPRPAASSAALLMRRPDERRSIDLETLSEVIDSRRCASIASMLLLIRRDMGGWSPFLRSDAARGAARRSGHVGELSGSLRRLGVLGRNSGPDLLAVHGDRPGRGDADAHGRAGDLDHLDADVVADSDLLARAPGDDEHRNSSLENGSGRLHLPLRGRALEQRGTDGSVGGLVDDLVAAGTRDQDRRVEVWTKTPQRIGCTDRDVDGRVVLRGQADAGRLVVRELDLVVGE